MVAATPAKPDLDVVATTLDGTDITRGYVLPNLLLLPQDTILTERGGADLALYEDLLRDEQVAATFAQRRLAVISKDWYVEPGGTRAVDQAAAASLEAQLRHIGFDAVSAQMLFGRFYGYSAAELIYAQDGREVVIDQIRVRKSRRFRFDGELRPRLLTYQNMMPGELLPPAKFWFYVTGADNSDEPYGLGLGHSLYWPVIFKRNGMRFWLIFLDKFGMPTATGTYPAGSTAEQKQTLLNALAAIATDSGVIVPEGMAIELLQATRQGTADYSTLINQMNDAIAKVVVGHTAAAEATPGRLGGEPMAEEVRGDLIRADANSLCESFNRGPAQWITQWNYPTAAPPRVWRHTDEPTDQVNRSTALMNLAKLGYRPTLEQVSEEFGGNFVDVGMPGANAGGADAPAAPTFAEADPTQSGDPPAQMVAQTDQAVAPALDDWIGKIKALVDSADSLAAVRDGLLALYPQMTLDQYAAAMQQALTAATLAGRYDIMEQASGGS